ncbi:MAG TPA: hypothetical protein VHV75_02710 [Solirubrobacteraceae bacterium]|nr:hypothetical protein [Solirubrobacteraceae bacterium]
MSALATVAILITLLAQYANHALVSPGNFSDRAVNALHAGDVESLVVQTVTDRVVADAGDEASLRPAIQAAVLQAVSSAQVNRGFRDAAESLHGELMSGTADELSLTLPGIGPAIASSIGSDNPELAEEVRDTGTITVLDVRIPPSGAKDVHDLVSVAKDSSELLIGTVVLVLLALIISPSRRRTLVGLGLGAAVSGLVVVAIYVAGRGIVVNEFSTQDARTAAHALWSAYLGGLEIWGFVLAGVGAVIACASQGLR